MSDSLVLFLIFYVVAGAMVGAYLIVTRVGFGILPKEMPKNLASFGKVEEAVRRGTQTMEVLDE